MTVRVREVLRTRLGKKNVKVFGAFRSVFVCQMFVGLLSVQLVGFSVICVFFMLSISRLYGWQFSGVCSSLVNQLSSRPSASTYAFLEINLVLRLF